MKRVAHDRVNQCTRRTRRHFLSSAVAAAAWPLPWCGATPLSKAVAAETTETALAFKPAGNEYHFDTGSLRGTLRSRGRSLGVTPAIDIDAHAAIAGDFGLLSPYRMLDAEQRYGDAGWNWPSTSRRLAGGSVQVDWPADAEHPFSMQAIYQWRATRVLDVTIRIVAQRDMHGFELIWIVLYILPVALILFFPVRWLWRWLKKGNAKRKERKEQKKASKNTK